MKKVKYKQKSKLFIAGGVIAVCATGLVVAVLLKHGNTEAYFKNHTLPAENLSFDYPADWSIESESGSDSIAINSPINGTEAFQINISAGGQNVPIFEIEKVIGSIPVDFVGKKGYMVFVDTPQTPGRIARAYLSASRTQHSDFFNAVQGGYININAAYNMEEDSSGGKTLGSVAEAAENPKYRVVKKIIESATYK